MSRQGAGGAANRGVGGHIKEGFKNIPKVYNALYNQKLPTGAKLGSNKTVGNNVKTIVTGKASPTAVKQSPKVRAQLAGMGAASITPVGPVAAFAMGVKKSVADKKSAKAAAAPKPAAQARVVAPTAITLPKSKPAKAGPTSGAMGMAKGISAMKRPK